MPVHVCVLIARKRRGRLGWRGGYEVNWHVAGAGSLMYIVILSHLLI